MKAKTFLDNKFYQKSMVTQKELAEYWNVSQAYISELVTKGVIKRNKLNKISMKHIMDLEEIGKEELEHININKIVKENNSLKEENERLTVAISELRIAAETILKGVGV